MRRVIAALVFATFLASPARAQELVHFPSLNDNGAGQPPTMLDGYLYRPTASGRRPAVLLLHGCGGLLLRSTGWINRREQEWAATFTARGWTVLMVDSFRPRGTVQMCAPADYDEAIVRKRPLDVYGALAFLRAQPAVRGDRIAMIGWSQGGGTVLRSIAADSLDRPKTLPQGDFRAAVAFYPALCDPHRQSPSWTNAVPLLVLTGAEDVWTPAAPCRALIEAATARGAGIDLQVYPGAYHDFDVPGLARQEMPQFRTRSGVVPIEGTDPAARADVFARVPAFLARYLDAP